MSTVSQKINNENIMNCSILIPCLNESITIKKAVTRANKYAKKYLAGNYEIIVADNGSNDGTLEILEEIQKSVKQLKIIKVPTRGYGSALHYGIISAKHPFVIFADADLSYDFKEIGKFIPQSGSYDLILGSRIRGTIEKNAMPWVNRYIGTPVLTFLIRSIYKINSSDCNSGMRMIKKSFYKKLKMQNSGMEWASELLIKAALQNAIFKEVPIIFKKDERGHKPHLKRWEDGWRHLKVIILLKPSILIMISLAALTIGIIFSYFSLFTTIAMSLLAEFLILAYLAAKKLESAMNHSDNFVVGILNNIPLVFIGALLTTLGFILMFVISDNHLFTKYIILSQVVMYDLWLFFIETVQSFLTNRLEQSH